MVEGAPNLHRLTGQLFRSAQPTAEGMKNLEKLGIRTVVDLRAFHSDEDELKGRELKAVKIPMKTWHAEREDLVKFLKVATDPQQGPVLVHCQHGADRTGTACAVYRIVVQGWSKEEALREMTEGGYGFHEIWKNLPDWIRDLDVAAMRKEVGIKGDPEQDHRDAQKVSRYLGYRKLVRLTEKPIAMQKAAAERCSIDAILNRSPHVDPAMHLYVNQATLDFLGKHADSTRYPLGTLLVKEKFQTKDAEKAHLITVMEKVADDGKVDDWQFTMINLMDHTVVKDGFPAACIKCHAAYGATGFVSGTTVPLLRKAAGVANGDKASN